MSTGTRLDRTASGGLGGLRERLHALQENIKAENEKAERFVKEKDEAHRNYCKLAGRAKHLKEKISNKEEEIQRTETKISDVEGRIREKEEYLKEAAKFHQDLTKATPSEGERANKEKELDQYKAIYNEGHHRYMQAKEKKIDLEERCEHFEMRNREVQKKLDALQQELEHSLMEEGRRGEQCKQSMDASFKIEKNLIGVQRLLDVMLKRKEDATKKTAELRKNLTATEDELETMCYDRRVIEATIREILLKSNQN